LGIGTAQAAARGDLDGPTQKDRPKAVFLRSLLRGLGTGYTKRSALNWHRRAGIDPGAADPIAL